MHILFRHLLILSCLGLYTSNGIAEENTIGGDFELTSHLNKPYSLTDSRGKVVLLFFGFTHCPDICPNTLSTVQTVLSQLGEQAALVQPLFISVDPKRDSVPILEQYLKYFSNKFIGLTGTTEKIDKVIQQYGGFYSYSGNTDSNAYTVDHTSNLYIISTEGEVANIIPYGIPPQAIREIIQKLLPESVT